MCTSKVRFGATDGIHRLLQFHCPPIMAITDLIDMTSRGKASLNRVSELLDTKNEVTDKPTATAVEKVDGEIEFRNLTFRHPDADYDALINVSFKIQAGESIGVIGKTGCGKPPLPT